MEKKIQTSRLHKLRKKEAAELKILLRNTSLVKN